LENDYGKDAYVDLTVEGMVTGLCVALQVKGGTSYRAAGGYRIPVNQEHYAVWRGSSLPVAGIVLDPDTGLLHWCNISAALEQSRGSPPASIFVPSERILNADTLRTEFFQDMLRFTQGQTSGKSLLSLVTDSEHEQVPALWDCFALGRRDARFLVIVRHLLAVLSGESLRTAVRILAHATPHPDIMWHQDNWIPPDVESEIRSHFRWSVDDVVLLLRAVAREEWERGCLGEDLYMLLVADPHIKQQMESVAVECARRKLTEEADTAIYLTVYWAEDEGRERFRDLLRRNPELRDLPNLDLLADFLKEHERVWLFE